MPVYDVHDLGAKAVWPPDAPFSLEGFCGLVLGEGEARYRDLPWRNSRDPYEVLVSEVMLQQTQVKRVLDRWGRFLAKFPTVDALSAASTSDVLCEWQGLGYNRRALSLKRCAEICSSDFGGSLPKDASELLKLPGIGPATAAGVRAFAFDEPGVYLETNVRTVFLHELFPQVDGVSDKDLAPLVAATCLAVESPRVWYYALLDYGAYLKSQVTNPSRRSAHYARQSAFEGSRRQKRAELLRIILASPSITLDEAAERLSKSEVSAGRREVDGELFREIVSDLEHEGFFQIIEGRAIP